MNKTPKEQTLAEVIQCLDIRTGQLKEKIFQEIRAGEGRSLEYIRGLFDGMERALGVPASMLGSCKRFREIRAEINGTKMEMDE